MTEPTDAELTAFTDAFDLDGWVSPALAKRAFARAVLAKWGPPSGAVNWVGLSSHHLLKQEPLGAEFEAVLDKHRSELYAEATTPQPTQAQAGAVPLTDKQARELVELESWGPDAISLNAQLLRTIRRTEAAHGIKGGQHGAE